jgi:predicted MPP superfamily phosphohydrolase
MSKRNLIIGSFLFVLLVIFFIYLNNKKNNLNPTENNLTNNFETTENKNYDLKIGYITDLHCYSNQDSETGEWEFNWRCSQPMTNFINMMNDDFNPDVVVEGGDMVDGRDKQERNIYPVVLDFFDKLKVPHFHIVGNHETRGFYKKDWLTFTDYKKPYYFQDIKDYRLIFLDGNNKMTAQGKVVDTSPELHFYPGYLDPEQRIWLEETLKTADEKEIIVFVHQPPLEKTLVKESKELFIDGGDLRKMFASHGVKAVISGHIEEMCYIEEDGVDYYTLQGVHKVNRQFLEEDAFKDQGSFYQITVDEDQKLEVRMFYKDKEALKYNSFVVNQETAICNNESIQNPEKYEAKVEQAELEEELED